MKTVLIYNDKSGGTYTLRTLRPMLRKHGIKFHYSFTVRQLSSRKLASLISSGCTVLAVGGDGTLNAVARLLVDTPSILVPLPGGTFNHFIRDLGMSSDVKENLSRYAHGKTHKIDVAYVNDQLFLNNSNIGLYPFSLIERKTTKRFVGKYVAAFLSAIDQLSIFRRHHLKIDDTFIRSPFVFVGNNIYDIQAALIPQRTSINKGLLTVMVASASTRIGLIRDILSVLKGNVSQRDDFNVSTRKELTIYSRRPSLPVSFDGEVARLSTPLRYAIRPKSLKVMVIPRPR